MPDFPQGERIPGENPSVAAIPYAPNVLAKAPPPLFSQGAGSAGHFHPLAHEGELPHNVRERSAERRGHNSTPCGARPVRWAFTSRRSTAAFFLRPRDRLLKRTGAPFTESP